jgi:hypothetical protein
MKLTVNRIPDWMGTVSWQEEWNNVDDLKEHWKLIAEEVDSAMKEGTGLADLQRKYKCPITVLNMIWLNIKHGYGSLQ